ncbi:MAG: hypothetical protein CMJ59_01665 [Planctomycetaceae bacterium]|nr:hypothetical protein [Planctomycetaceae bacterium]
MGCAAVNSPFLQGKQEGSLLTAKRNIQSAVRYENAGRVVIVTGACSGIGWAIAQGFCDSGAEVVAVDIDEAAAADLPGGVRFFRADVGSQEECRAAVESAVAEWGGVDVLVNNAAIQPPDSYLPMDQYPAELWDRIVAVNLSGYAFMAKYALAVMKRQQSGVVVNIASAQGHRTARGVPAYGPIKSANLMQSRQWGVEYARLGIRVVSVSPGAIATPLVTSTAESQGGERQLANRHPLGRIGEPQEVANAVLWLSSQDASFVTATDLEVDGGLGAFAAFADPYALDSHTQSEGERTDH